MMSGTLSTLYIRQNGKKPNDNTKLSIKHKTVKKSNVFLSRKVGNNG